MAFPAETTPSSFLTKQFSLPPGKLYVLHGGTDAFHLAHTVAFSMLRRRMRVAVVDGGNWFNAHALIHSARLARQHPDRLLRNLFLSRSFTCYQMEQAVVNLLPAFLKSIDSRAAMILGLLDTLYDEQAPLGEVRQILHRVLAALQALKTEGISVLVTCLDRSVLPEQRNRLFEALFQGMDVVYRLDYDNREHPLLIREHTFSAISEHYALKGAHYGTHRADVYQYHRQRGGQLVQISPGPPPRRPGDL
jgi:hypothetical protein